MCAAISSYVHACAAAGIQLPDWRNGVCGESQMYLIIIIIIIFIMFPATYIKEPLIGPYLASGAIDLITGACVVASLQLAHSVLFPPAPRVGKL